MKKLQKLVNQLFSSYYMFQLRNDQWRSSNELKTIQFKKLKAIIKHAYDYVPYYHRLLSSANIKPEDIKDNEDLMKIPLTSKQDLQKNYPDTITRGLDSSRLSSSFTSGSTGIPLGIQYGNSDIARAGALARYPFLENGVRRRDSFVTVWGRAQSITWGKKYVRFLGDITETVIPLYPQEKLVEVLRLIRPNILNTFPSVLSTLANYDLTGIHPRLIFTQGEMVTPDCREVVKQALNSELLETYGSVEFVHLAFECSEHCGLHAITSESYMEFVDGNGEHVSSGDRGEIVVTAFWNHTMPFIRYRIGDSGIPLEEECTCGRSWPLVKDIQGRINECIVLPSGRRISWLHIYHHFYKELERNVLSISQYQIVQDKKDRIVFKVAEGKTFDPKMPERIRANLEAYFAGLGENLEVLMRVVDEIPRERTGKRRMLISTLI